MSELVRKAIIPTAGLGTRLRPVTEAVSKELLPIGSVPMVHRAIAELVRGQVQRIAIVVNPGKLAVQDYIDRQQFDCQIEYFVQEEPRGVADAILLADEFLADEPFVFFMPDEVCFCPTSPILQLGQVYELCQHAVLGLTWIPPEWLEFVRGTGRIVTEPLEDGLFRIVQLMDKSRDRFSSSNVGQLKGAGIGILDGEFLQLARQRQQDFDGEREFDDLPLWQELVERNRLLGVMADGAIVDAGNPLGFGLANRYWLEVGRYYTDAFLYPDGGSASGANDKSA